MAEVPETLAPSSGEERVGADGLVTLVLMKLLLVDQETHALDVKLSVTTSLPTRTRQ